MQTARDDKVKDIFDEVARGSNLGHTLSLIADQVAADLGAPTCKIWVVKRGDICDRCPLAGICTNRQMCMHLVAASGAAIDREYPRIPLSVFKPSLIATGGTSDFQDQTDAGQKLFGLQHGAHNEGRDSYALFPLRGVSGTVGLVGVFNHRLIEPAELQRLGQLAGAAAAAIRVAELQSRYEAVRHRLGLLEKETAALRSAQETESPRTGELEEAVIRLTEENSQLRVDRDELLRSNEGVSAARAHLEEENQRLRERVDYLTSRENESQRTYSEMAAHFESERRRLERENLFLAEHLRDMEKEGQDLTRERERLTAEVADRTGEMNDLQAKLESTQNELKWAFDEVPKLQERISVLEEANSGLRSHNAAIAESVDDLERSLSIAEDARARLEQARLSFEIRLSEANQEADRFRTEHARIDEELQQLGADSERLATDVLRAESERDALREELQKLEQSNATLTGERNTLENQTAQLEHQNAIFAEANSQLERAVIQLEAKATELEESTTRLRDRAEAGERARSELDQRYRALLEQNRRLKDESHARARFLADMSHELRTPMNAIIGFTSLLLDDRSLQMSDRHRRSLERVARNARDLLELINNILDFSKIQAGRMEIYSEATDVRDLVERAVGVVEPLREGRLIKLTTEIEDDLPTIRADRTKLQQVLINLLSNAVKFTREGEVKVTALRAGADSIRIGVSDTGVGIADADLQRVFDEFRQVGKSERGARQGTGLGLAITRRLVDLMGGEITVSSRLGEGSIFSIKLPLEMHGQIAPVPEADIQSFQPGLTALVIEGDPGSLYLVKKYLGEAGYSVAATDDPARGLEIVGAAKPALVVIGIDSTDSSLKTLNEIAGADQEHTVIAMAADAALEHEAVAAGARGFVVKPVERVDLLRSLERARAAALGSVLVVDDDADTLDLVVAMIEDSGYDIRTARTGTEALEKVGEARPDAIILDLMLPEMDGFEVLHRLGLNSEWSNIPVMLLTARDLSHEERRALDMATVRLLQKGTFSRDELVGEIKQMVRKSADIANPAVHK